MGETIRVGTIGTSFISDYFHLPILSAQPEAEPFAICGRDEQRAHEVAEKHSIPRVFTDYREMFDSRLLDAVVIATPDDLHHTMAMEAIRHGLHVLCEKPLALNAAQAREMRDAAQSTRQVAMVNHNWRCLPVYRYAKKLLEDGFVGDLRRVAFQYNAGYALSKTDRWKFDAARSLGVLGNLGSHMIDLARYLVGDITEVSAKLNTFVPIDADAVSDSKDAVASNDLASLLVEFAGGVSGHIFTSAVDYCKGQIQNVELHGTQGSLHINVVPFGKPHISCIRGEEFAEETLEIPEELGGYSSFKEIDEYFAQHDIGPRQFVQAILGNMDASPTFDDGYKIQQVIDAAIQSHAEQRWVRVDSIK